MSGWIPNFLRPGFAKLTLNPSWPDASAIPDLSGKTAIVLGANSGVGYQTALQLARKGAKVYATARSPKKAEETILKIETELSDENVQVLPLVVVLDDFTQVRNTARALLAENKRLDILVNNAGVLENEFHLTKDGVEYDFAVNYISHFIFTTTLLPILSPGARIVNITSYAQQFGSIILDLDRINNPEDPQLNSWLSRYGHSKLAQVLFTRGLQRRVSENVYVNCCHPGQIGTGLNRHVAAPGTGMQGMAIRLAMRLFDEPASVGALTQLYLATSPEVEKKEIKGEFFYPVALKAMDKINRIALDDDMVEKLWRWTEEVVKEKVKD
jgi:NAD(P)-dependent dehydrogenase (short-subunit alcohol dehydrogenase family)